MELRRETTGRSLRADVSPKNVVLMKYSEEEILAYARSRLQHIDQQKGKRSVMGLMGICAIVIFLGLIQMTREKSVKTGADLFLDERFLEGAAMGIFMSLGLGVSAQTIVRVFAGLYGKEIEAFRLLVKLKEGNRGQNPPRGDG